MQPLVKSDARCHHDGMGNDKLDYLALYANEETYRRYSEYLREYRRKMRELRRERMENLAHVEHEVEADE